MTTDDVGPRLDARRARAAALELTGPAVAALSPLVRNLPMESLTPVKQLLKQYFSDRPWADADDDALATLVGPDPGGDAGAGRQELAPDLVLVWGWPAGRFRLRVEDEHADD